MHEYGIDIGSVSIKCAEFIDNELVNTRYQKHLGKPYNLLISILADCDAIDKLILTGSATKAIHAMLGAVYVNEVEATAYGVLLYHPDIQSIIEIGGEDSKLINISNYGIKDFASNTICAAGTGIFLDQQARRLCFDVEELGAIARESKNPARIAGRCSVFAKSDMIHLQQIGTKPEDLIAGLCLALARNFKSAIAKGKDISSPVAFVGGVAANQGMVQAFKQVLEIKSDLIIPRYYNCIGAIGAVLSARKKNTPMHYLGIDELNEWLTQPKTVKRLAPLDGRKKWSPLTTSHTPRQRTKAWLGIDVGSISTNLVLIDERGTVLARRYLWTRGRPIEVVLQGLNQLYGEIGSIVDICGVGTTGSGRYLIGEFIGADLVKNEISAQARSAIEINPLVDTIFEIGGQDSKFISLRDRAIVDFEMNKVCAAGTGSFLEEQAEVLGVELEKFGDLALSASSPINLGERCTVFIGSEIVHHQKDVKERENLLAGLGYSIVFNYLNRVVNGKHIGNTIFFQGGVAANKAVISAFEHVLNKKITVPVNYDVSGAIGIALLTKEANLQKTSFRGFKLASQPYTSCSFICHHCSNECEVNRITIESEKTIYCGGRCERYEEKKENHKQALPDYFALRNELFFKTEPVDGVQIGLPRSLLYYELFPFFYKFLTELGLKPILSDCTTRKTIELGTEASVADTCLPVKVAFGHVRNLMMKGIHRFFMPSVITMPARQFSRSYVCPYVQTVPYMMRAVFAKEIEVHAPYIYFDRGREGIVESLLAFAHKLGKKEKEARRALQKAQQHYIEVQKQIEALGAQALRDIQDRAFVVCSRPYNGYDVGMNLDLPKKIRNLGVPALPMDFIPVHYDSIRDDFHNMYWHYGQRLLATADAIRNNDRLFAVYLSNFSCGPDSFLTRFFKERLGEKPSLLIELDEHSGDAGFITRCEAFYDSIKHARRTSSPRKIQSRSEVKKGRTIYVPNMCDGAKIFASAMRYAGTDAQVLPQPDEESIITGRQFTSGRECFPAILTAGDMVKKIRSPDFDPDMSGFFMAQGSGPCRFGQYYKLHRIILDDLGLSRVPIYAPNQGPSLFDDLGPMGMKFLLLVWDGICAIDGLEAKSRGIRPYEKIPGTTDALYNQALEKLCSLVEKGERITPYLREVNRQLDDISTDEREEKPRIGIVGEIYVRSQTFSNNFLVHRLEELGCEVALPSIAEWFFYTNFTRMRNCRWFHQHRRVLFTTLFNRYMRWRQNAIYRLLGLSPETDVKTLLCLARPYLHSSFEGEAIVTLGKTLEFMRDDFNGVVNVLPFTCMPGNIVATLYKKLKDDYPDFSLFTLAVDGLNHAVDSMRLETFVSQAKNYRTS